MRRVITYGTFDTLHYGHILLLKRAKCLGTELVVGVSTDEFNHNKGKTSHFCFNDRVELLSAIKFVDKIIPETCWEQKIDDIKKLGIDIFAIGEDWEGKFNYLSEYCQVKYLPRTPNISSTFIKQNL